MATCAGIFKKVEEDAFFCWRHATHIDASRAWRIDVRYDEGMDSVENLIQPQRRLTRSILSQNLSDDRDITGSAVVAVGFFPLELDQ